MPLHGTIDWTPRLLHLRQDPSPRFSATRWLLAWKRVSSSLTRELVARRPGTTTHGNQVNQSDRHDVVAPPYRYDTAAVDP